MWWQKGCMEIPKCMVRLQISCDITICGNFQALDRWNHICPDLWLATVCLGVRAWSSDIQRSILINTAEIVFLGSDGPGTTVLFRCQRCVWLHLMSVLCMLQSQNTAWLSFEIAAGYEYPQIPLLTICIVDCTSDFWLKVKVLSVYICKTELRITSPVWGLVCNDSPIPWKEEPGMALNVLGPSSSQDCWSTG